MTQRTLACSVSASVYDQFRALLPDGADVNRQLCALVDAFIAGAPAEVDMAALKARWHVEWGDEHRSREPVELPDTAPMAVYDPDRPLQEQIDELGTSGVMQFLDAVDYRAADYRAAEERAAEERAAEERAAEERFIRGETGFGPVGAAWDAALAEKRATGVTRTLADPETCLHPHESLVRDGRFVRCTLCDRIIR